MNRIHIKTLGRARENTVVVADDSVSRRHAEIITAHDWLYVTDCASTSGSYVWRRGNWQVLRQDYIKIHEKLRFGDYEIPAADLWQTLQSDHGKIPVRNPETGEIQSTRVTS